MINDTVYCGRECSQDHLLGWLSGHPLRGVERRDDKKTKRKYLATTSSQSSRYSRPYNLQTILRNVSRSPDSPRPAQPLQTLYNGFLEIIDEAACIKLGGEDNQSYFTGRGGRELRCHERYRSFGPPNNDKMVDHPCRLYKHRRILVPPVFERPESSAHPSHVSFYKVRQELIPMSPYPGQES